MSTEACFRALALSARQNFEIETKQILLFCISFSVLLKIFTVTYFIFSLQLRIKQKISVYE